MKRPQYSALLRRLARLAVYLQKQGRDQAAGDVDHAAQIIGHLQWVLRRKELAAGKRKRRP